MGLVLHTPLATIVEPRGVFGKINALYNLHVVLVWGRRGVRSGLEIGCGEFKQWSEEEE